MKLRKIILPLFLALSLYANEAHDEAEKIITLINKNNNYDKIVEQLLKVQMQIKPQLRPFENVLREFFAKYINFNSIKEDLISLYTNRFTADELKEIRKFYESPVGKKTITELPKITYESNQIGIRKVQAHQEELKQMLQKQVELMKEKQKINNN
ncbi:hypothetical protein CPU12_06020 [Malaciobacter molluscorum LMG 25693]|uniref:DUF2059 domain-containing protein n=1 Tax=Malaciobacter molluscorum LMG 25693 TaxID=870501 RepID=A0A2G1DIF0_9BACT|nr:DUF2059 domain-containing protein [Malaciobacter molluscorum]AXX91864.1 DUF2059 domain-containing protein [Malaciobacter molluscorum LMG 25693]PHO18273.1 hypothetical protein CPU12_06020 [Malaciobacter molluscorum LMG 25693]RXJ94156.1 hypothetical protein CRV00_07965 [Malaciobacter molluscorum]